MKKKEVLLLKKMFHFLVCATILSYRVMADGLIVNRHFKGDMFSKDGKFKQVLTSRRLLVI